MRTFLAASWIVAFLAIASAGAHGADEKPAYTTREIEGFKILVHPRVLAEKELRGDEALELLRVKLYDMKRVIPAKALAEIVKVPIWLEAEDPRHPGACYHPNKAWLEANGYDPAKAKSVQISNPINFLNWSKEQPAMVLHEMAHAYHDLVLGHNNIQILEAHKNAVEKKLYEAVLRINGRTEKAYGIQNEKEYFAESSEAYFGTNDFFPFVRAELEKHDPVGFKAVKEVWERGENVLPPQKTSGSKKVGMVMYVDSMVVGERQLTQEEMAQIISSALKALTTAGVEVNQISLAESLDLDGKQKHGLHLLLTLTEGFEEKRFGEKLEYKIPLTTAIVWLEDDALPHRHVEKFILNSHVKYSVEHASKLMSDLMTLVARRLP